MTASGNERHGQHDPFAALLGSQRGPSVPATLPGPSFRARAREFFENMRHTGLAGERPLDTVGRNAYELGVEHMGYVNVEQQLDGEALLLSSVTADAKGDDSERALLVGVFAAEGHYAQAWLCFIDRGFEVVGDGC